MSASRRPPRKVTPRSLENVAHHYLARFAASSDSLRQVLRRRVRRSAEHHEIDIAEAEGWIEELIERFHRSGLLNDQAFASARAHSLHRRGTSRRMIAAKLTAKGIASEEIDAALEELSTEHGDEEFAAAVNLARRRRLGPFRAAERRAEFRRKDLASLARAGFSHAVAQRVLSAETPEELDEMMES